MKYIKIADRYIGEGYESFIIAEAGVNHNGDVTMAKQLIDIASDAKADAVKFQTFQTDSLVTSTAEKAPYQKETTNSEESQYEMLKKLELKPEDFIELSEYTRKKGLLFLSSPFDRESVDFLDTIDVPAFKIPSGEITNQLLLRHIAGKGKPVIMATGMSTLEETEKAVTVLRDGGVSDIVLLHCVSAYPAKVEETNLRAMATMRSEFDLPTGYSDHTPGIEVPVAAVALGACVIEKHFTIDKSLPGPDHRASLDPAELVQMVASIRNIEKAMGNGIKQPTPSETDTKKAARRSLVARIDIPQGTVITEDMLDVKRPGTGIKPGDLDKVVGQTAKCDIRSGDMIRSGDIE